MYLDCELARRIFSFLTTHNERYELWCCGSFPLQNPNFIGIEKYFNYTAVYTFIEILNGSLEDQSG
jgi:hypothetical protein